MNLKLTLNNRSALLFVIQISYLIQLNPDGTTSIEIYDEWVDATFPTEYKGFAKKFFGDCYSKYGKGCMYIVI